MKNKNNHKKIVFAALIVTIATLTFLSLQKDSHNIPDEVNTATAGYLKNICSLPKNDRDKFLCIGRINGFVAGWVASDALDAKNNKTPNLRIMCPEQYLTNENPLIALGIFLEWMKKNPQAENLSYIDALSNSLSEALVCKEQRALSSQVKVQRFIGRLDENGALKKFSQFISNNDGEIVYIDTFIPETIAFQATHLSGFTAQVDCGEEFGCPGDEYIINLTNGTDAIYHYVPRLEEYHLKGYWAVMAGTAFNQGISSNVLRGVATENVK